MSGSELSRRFYADVVAPLLAEAMPGLGYAAGPLAAATTAAGWHDRESGLAQACEVLLSAQRARGLPAPAVAVIQFWDRPYRTVDEAVPEALLAGITNPDVTRLPPVGSVEQWVTSVDVLVSPARRSALRAVYRDWAGRG